MVRADEAGSGSLVVRPAPSALPVALQGGYVARRVVDRPSRLDPLDTRHVFHSVQHAIPLVGQHVAAEGHCVIFNADLDRMRMAEMTSDLGSDAVVQYGVVRPSSSDLIAGTGQDSTTPVGDVT